MWRTMLPLSRSWPDKPPTNETTNQMIGTYRGRVMTNPTIANRRTFLKLAGITLATPALLRTTYTYASEPITYVGWGGAAQEVASKVFIEPFTKETGIQVQVVNGPDLAKAKGQVDSGQIE